MPLGEYHDKKIKWQYLTNQFTIYSKHFKTEKINSWIEKNVMVLPIDVGMSHEVNKDIAIRYGNPVRSGIPSLVLLNPSGKMVFSTSKGELARARDINKEDLLLWLRANLGTLIK